MLTTVDNRLQPNDQKSAATHNSDTSTPKKSMVAPGMLLD